MPTREDISLAFLVLFPLFEATCYAQLHRKRRELLVRKRNTSAVYVASLAGWLACFNLAVSLFGAVPCGAFYVAALLVAPTSVGPQIVRALALRGAIQHSQLLVESEISTRVERNRALALPTIASGVSSSEQEAPSPTPHLMTKMMEAELVMQKTRRMVTATKWAMVLVPAVFLFLAVALSLSSDASQFLATDFDQCQPEPIFFQYACPAFGVATTALALAVTVLVKKVDDELGLKSEIQRNAVLLGCTYAITIIVRFAGYHEWQPLLQTIQQMMLSFSMAIVPFLPGTMCNSMAVWAKKRINPATKSAVPGYAQALPRQRGSTRTSMRKVIGGRRQTLFGAPPHDDHDRDVTVSWDAGLCILLSTENGIDAFCQHCAREFSSENVLFWCAVNSYRERFDIESYTSTSTEDEDVPGTEANNDRDARDDAKEIYKQFISSRSKTQVNLSSKQKGDIKKTVDSGEVTKDLFDLAQREIFAVMSRDSYPRFLASKKNRKDIGDLSRRATVT